MTVTKDAVEYIRENGPSTAEQILVGAYGGDEIDDWTVPNVENLLSESDEVTQDDSGRWHLTDEYKDRDYKVEQIVMVPHRATYKVEGGELVEEDMSGPIDDEKGCFIERHRPYELYDYQTGEFIDRLDMEEEVLGVLREPYDGIDTTGESYTCENCGNLGCVIVPLGGGPEMTFIDKAIEYPEGHYRRVVCYCCGKVFYDEDRS